MTCIVLSSLLTLFGTVLAAGVRRPKAAAIRPPIKPSSRQAQR
ncbi:hypothetical protein [Dyella mobilis]|nr:hypothetical protein [Dyella mobilis]